MSSTNRLAKNALSLNIRMIVTLFISLYTSRVILRTLGVEDFGLYNLVGGFVALLGILTSAITGTSVRFITYELGTGNEDKLRRTFSTILTVLLLFAIGIAILGAVIGPWFIRSQLNIPYEKLGDAYFVYYCSLFVFVMDMYALPYTSLVMAYEKMGFYAIMGMFVSVGKLVIVLVLPFFGSNALRLYAFLLVIIAIIDRFGYGLYCKCCFKNVKNKFLLDREILKKIFSFSIWIGIGTAAGILKDQGGNILVNIFFGLVYNAALGIANQIMALVSQFGSNIGVPFNPQITKEFASGNTDKAIKLTWEQVKFQGVIMLLIAVPLLCETHYLLYLWLGTFPDYTVLFVRLMIILCIISTLAQGYGALYLANGDIKKYQIFSTFVMLLYIPVCYVLLHFIHKPELCLWVSIFLQSFFLLANFLYLSKKVCFPVVAFFIRVIFRLFFISCIALFLGYLMHLILREETFCRLLLVGILGMFSVGGFSYFYLLDMSEKKWIKNIMFSKLYFMRKWI
ncbi:MULTISPECIES: lipopolysaccharide biosynthesis protein [Prevotellaceae]|uniref:lipopolysaccharide biosynthesis protein n=1 Tax=Prevotellaceae TaxID=171552 RepID=UPI0003D3B152|nr:oligosaccharide flippase family protein [Prevotella phocaeensis]ETD21593.1 hypothetical protein HMPREF1199_00668 [Hoylesella oralis CC98A]